MAGIGRTVLTLRFFANDLDPLEVTGLLGAEPTESARKGDLSPSGRPARTASWRFTVDDRTPGDLEGQLVELFGHLTDDLDAWKRLNDRYQGDLFCGLFMERSNEGLNLTAETLAAIGNRGLKLALDIYDPVEE